MSVLPPQTQELRKLVHRATTQINLMRQALHLADKDREQTGAVSCTTIEFIRSVKGLLA